MNEKKHISENFCVGMLLAVAGGYFDAYTYLCRGKVFANAQTGNIVLLGINLKERNFRDCLFYLMPILAFVMGVFIIEFLKMKFEKNPSIHWHQLSVVCEILIAAVVGVLPSGKYDPLANILISLTCAMQVEAFRKLNGNPFTTTMCTGNLRSGTDNLFAYFRSHDKAKLKISIQYFGIIVFFIAGAAIGAFFSYRLGTKSVLLVETALIAVLLILIAGNEKKA